MTWRDRPGACQGADKAVAQALLDKGNPVLVAYGDARYRAGEANAARKLIQLLLRDRGIAIDVDARARIAACSELAVLERWLVRAARVTNASDLFDDD